MVNTILGLIEGIIHIIGTKLDQKYADRYTALKKAYYEEWNKPLDQRSDAVLDNLYFELCVLGNALATLARTTNP